MIEKMASNIVEIKLSEIDKVQEVLSKQNQEIERLTNIINKAIEYIEENKGTYESNEYCFDNMLEDVIPLVDILKGSDKE